MAPRSLPRIAGDYISLVQLIQEGSPEHLPDARTLRSQLLALLEPIGKGGVELDVGQDELDEARFALVCWADETILKSQWMGREEWGASTLQTQLFSTTRGGNEFYEHLSRLRPDQNHAREIYLLVLAMGFEGQYAGQPDQRNAIMSHQYETLRTAGRILDPVQENPVTPAAYNVDIELPRGGGLGIFGYIGLMLLGLAGVFGLMWLLLYFIGGDVPLPKGS